jgi:hypothetical protein
MSFAILSAIGAFACWKWGDWRNWKEYYSTIQYVYIGSIAYDFLCYGKILWAMGEWSLKFPFIDLFIMALYCPSTVILFLTFYPKKALFQLLYIALWVLINVAVELIAYLTGGIVYLNGWNLAYSAGFDLLMFPLIILHYKKPLLVWPISAILAFVMIWWFRIPLYK